MARKGITYDQVANAARAIKARGAEPTIAAVRVELGDEGSFTTISAHLSKWRAEEMDKVETRSLPPEVEDKMMEAMMVVWNAANKSATSDLNSIKQKHADEMKQTQEELSAAKAEIVRLEGLLSNALEEGEQAKKEAASLDKKLTACGAELEAVKALYQQVIKAIKQPAEAGGQGADTSKARRQGKEDAPGSKQA